jgi:hypothetical protein
MLANIATMLSFVPVLAEYEEFEDTKGVIRIRISKKNRLHNGQKEKVQKDKHDLHTLEDIAIITIL